MDPNDPANIEIAKQRGVSVEEVLAERIDMIEEDDSFMNMMESYPQDLWVERISYINLKVLVPPSHAEEPDGLEKVFKYLRSNDFSKLLGRDILSKVHNVVRKRWLPNYTLLDKRW